MASQGPLNPGSVVSDPDSFASPEPWVNPGNAAASDNSRATCSHSGVEKNTEYLYASNFGFTIPGGATIVGVVVEVEARSSTGSFHNFNNLIVGGALNDDYERSIAALDTTDTYYETGDVDDTWDAALTPEIVNASDFGVAFFVYNESGAINIEVDHIRMTVYYTGGASQAPRTTQQARLRRGA